MNPQTHAASGTQPRRAYAFGRVTNFRDLGGYRASGAATPADGQDSAARTVRWGRLFRSDSLAHLADEDRAAFSALGVRTVIDLRRAEEVTRWGRITYAGIDYHNIAPEHREWTEIIYDEAAGPARYLADRYHEMATDGAAGFARVLGLIALGDSAPVVVHCFAGKDRTGVFAALTLGLLGVADEDIAADYAASDAWSRSYAPADLPRHYVVAPAEAMLLFVTELRARHGSFEGYASRAGLTADQIAALRAHLLA